MRRRILLTTRYVGIEVLRFVREPIALFFTLIFPILLIYVFGGSFGSGTSAETGKSYYNSLVSIDVAFLIANFTLMGITNDLANQKETGVAQNLKALPIEPWRRLLIESASYLAILFTSTALITAYVFTAYEDVSFSGNLPLYLLAIVLAFFMFVAIARFIVTLNFSARTIQLVASSVFFVLLFTSGIVIPKQSLPALVQGVVDFSPLYRTFVALDGVWNAAAGAKDLLLNSAYFLTATAVFSALSWRKGA